MFHDFKYQLYYGELPEHRKDPRGKLWVRFRIEWKNAVKALLTAASPPPETYVSVARAIDFDVAHYATEGVVSFNLNCFMLAVSDGA